jgi:hypothetical protein
MAQNHDTQNYDMGVAMGKNYDTGVVLRRPFEAPTDTGTLFGQTMGLVAVTAALFTWAPTSPAACLGSSRLLLGDDR